MTDNTSQPATPRELRPMDPQLQDVQPGRGIVIHIEQAWVAVRRLWLRISRRSYGRRMEACRRGDFTPCPHPVLAPRNLKFHQNQGGWYWNKQDAPFAWQDNLPFARVGLAEFFLMGGGFPAAAIGCVWWTMSVTGTLQTSAGLLAITAGIPFLLITWFFRDPQRAIASDPGLVVSPADGKVVDIEELDHDEFVGGPAVRIGIFLSIFNVHINRAPIAGRVIGLTYRPGKYLNALRPESAKENEQLAIFLESSAAPYRGMAIRQITGAIARRIVCWVKPGDTLESGEQFGMIKLGSRTGLVMPRKDGLTIRTRRKDKVQAGSPVLAANQADSDR